VEQACISLAEIGQAGDRMTEGGRLFQKMDAATGN